MKTDAPFGCMVTLFVKRTSLPEAIESVQNSHEALTEHAQHPLASAEDQELAVLGDLRSLHIEVDQDDRIWVDDVATVQWLHRCSNFDKWSVVNRAAREVINSVFNGIGTDLIGTSLHFISIGGALRVKTVETVGLLLANPQPAAVIVKDRFRSVSLDSFRLPKYEEELSISVHALVSDGVLSDEESQGFVLRMDAIAVRPELFGHKSAWLARQVLKHDVYEEIKKQSPEALAFFEQLLDKIDDPRSAVELLKQTNRKLATLSGLRGILQTSAANIDVQIRHLQAKALGDGFAQQNEVYARRSQHASDSIKTLQSDLSNASKTLSECGLLVRAALATVESKLEENREKRVRRVERWIASIGVGLGSAALITEAVALQLIYLFGFDGETLPAASFAGILATFAVRTAVICALSMFTFFICGR